MNPLSIPYFLKVSLLILTFGFAQGCSKQEGCIDPNASNYVYEAQANDGSCLYDMSFVLATAQHLSVVISVDGIERDFLNYYEPGFNPGCGKDTLVGFDPNTVHAVANIALFPGQHVVTILAADGSTWEETYTLSENCLRIFIDAAN